MCLGLNDTTNCFTQHEPPTKRAEELKTSLQWILGAHFVVGVVKCILGGFNAGSGDFFSCLILWCGYLKYDYYQTFLYMIFCFQDAFMLSVSLGFWLQKNFFNKEMNGVEIEPQPRMIKPKKSEKGGEDDKNKDGDKYTWLRTLSEKMGRMTQESQGASNGIKKILSAMNIVIFISVIFLTFYMVALVYSFKSYKEFKGALEDTIGRQALEQHDRAQNIVAYGRIHEPPQENQALLQGQNNGQRTAGQNPARAPPRQGLSNIRTLGSDGSDNQSSNPQSAFRQLAQGMGGTQSGGNNGAINNKPPPQTRKAFQGKGVVLGGE